MKKIQKGGKIGNRYQFELPMIHISKIVCCKGVEKSSDNLYLDLGIKIVLSHGSKTLKRPDAIDKKNQEYYQQKDALRLNGIQFVGFMERSNVTYEEDVRYIG